MPIIETKFGMICILTDLWWNIFMDGWNVDENSLTKWQQNTESIIPQKIYKEWQIMSD